jgi:hypothetical protein
MKHVIPNTLPILRHLPIAFHLPTNHSLLFLKKQAKHIQSKAETYTVEGYNSRVRHYLARFKRKGKC